MHAMKVVMVCLVAVCGSLSLTGCGGSGGPATYTVSGTVTLDGAPVPTGKIAFRDPEGAVASAGGDITDGQFTIKSQPGRKQVEITAHRETGEFDESNPGEKIPLREQYIPARYNSETTLEEEVQAGSNQFTFELTSEET